jgi:hypothetical protein
MPLRRVFANRAGPNAIGLLIPPGPRTVVVMRPRALPWDFLCIHSDTDTIRFREFAREEAEAVAESLGEALEKDGKGASDNIETNAAPDSPGLCLRVALGRFQLIACPRSPGQSYRPMVWATAEEALQATSALRQSLYPDNGETREIYFNSRHFIR